MTKLEPARTSSDLTATERLRELLDERGVKYEGGERSLRWRDRNGVMMQAFPLADGELGMEVWSCTPEQAIAATLGESPRLPHFWTHDGTLHVELPKLPESISVRLPDQRDREVSSARVWQYTRDSGTCEIHDCEGSFSAVNRPVWRCDCGAFMTQFTDATTYHKPRFCPNCGRKVVDE